MDSLPMPTYQCHKKVKAMKISEIVPDFQTNNLKMLFEGSDGYVVVSKEWSYKNNPEVGGYYVVYEDGYDSYSPAKAFEEGYTLIS